MDIVDFDSRYIKQAAKIALQNYENERRHVPVMPIVETVPDLSSFAENGLGVAALEDDVLIGFLCVTGPFSNAFRSTNATGVFSPMGANGAIESRRSEIYARLYEAAAEKWVKAGASSHTISLYAHDQAVQTKFFHYGFGIRCIDAIRNMDEITNPSCQGYIIRELLTEEFNLIFDLNKQLFDHLKNSPLFMYYPSLDDEKLMRTINQKASRYFALFKEKQIIAYIKITKGGENFICETPDMVNIHGAYCLPEYRGRGIFQNLLNFVIQKLKAEGYKRLGVDFESFNPTAYGFWLKYFKAYTHSVVRRIDEYATGIK